MVTGKTDKGRLTIVAKVELSFENEEMSHGV
jgi:hypothetical protein